MKEGELAYHHDINSMRDTFIYKGYIVFPYAHKVKMYKGDINTISYLEGYYSDDQIKLYIDMLG